MIHRSKKRFFQVWKIVLTDAVQTHPKCETDRLTSFGSVWGDLAFGDFLLGDGVLGVDFLGDIGSCCNIWEKNMKEDRLWKKNME